MEGGRRGKGGPPEVFAMVQDKMIVSLEYGGRRRHE